MRTYAKEVKKEFLIECGITNVTDDGRVFCKDKEINAIKNGKYKVIPLYSPKLRQSVPMEKRTRNTGNFVLPLHVINFVWHHGVREEGFVIDHRDNNPENNHISNLQAITQKENLLKDKPEGYGTGNNTVKLCKKLTEEEILNKINYYIDLYERAKLNHDAKAAHKYRSQISQWRGKFKKFKEFQNTAEYKKIQEYKKLTKELAEAKKEYNVWRIWTLEAMQDWHDSKSKDDKYKYESAKLMLEGCKAKVKSIKSQLK